MPKTKAQVDTARVGDRQQRLLEQLEKIFLAEGFRDLTGDELAARLKCSKRSLYQIAPSKQELFLLVLEQFLERIRRKGNRGVLEHEDPEKRLAAYMEPGIVETRLASRRFVEDVESLRPAALLLESHQKERINTLRDIVEDGIRRGRFRKLNAGLVAETYLAGIERIDDPAFLRRNGLSFSEAFAELFQIIAFGVYRSDAAANEGAPTASRKR